MFFLSIPMLLVLMVLVVGSFFYSVPLISWKGKKVRIRESLYFKQLVLSVSWAIVTVVLPMLEEKIILMPGIVAAQFFSVVTFIYALCVPFEIRDMEREKLEGVQTIPVVYGTKVAKVLGVIALLIGSLMHLILFYENHISLYTLMALNISFLLTLFLMTFSARKPTDLYCKFYVDGLMIIQFLMVFVSLNLR